MKDLSDSSELQQFLKPFPVLEAQVGDPLLQPGDGSLFYSHEGVTGCYYQNMDACLMVNCDGPDQWFGLEGLLFGKIMFSYKALTPIKYRLIPSEKLRLSSLRDVITHIAMQTTHDWISFISQRVMIEQRAQERVLGKLLDLRLRIPDGVIPIRHEELAQMIGIRRSYVSQILNQLAKDKVLELGYHKIMLPEAAALKQLLNKS